MVGSIKSSFWFIGFSNWFILEKLIDYTTLLKAQKGVIKPKIFYKSSNCFAKNILQKKKKYLHYLTFRTLRKIVWRNMFLGQRENKSFLRKFIYYFQNKKSFFLTLRIILTLLHFENHVLTLKEGGTFIFYRERELLIPYNWPIWNLNEMDTNKFANWHEIRL